MPGTLPPAPLNEPPGSFAWQQWYSELAALYQVGGAIPWESVSKSGSTITDIVSRDHNNLQNIQGGTAGEYFHLTQAEYIAQFIPWTSWSPSRSGWTDVGAPTVTGRYCRLKDVVFFQIKVVPNTSVATTAGTSYTSLPLSAGASGMGGVVTMTNATTLISVGGGVIDVANSRCYVPSQVATGNTLTIQGSYEGA